MVEREEVLASIKEMDQKAIQRTFDFVRLRFNVKFYWTKRMY